MLGDLSGVSKIFVITGRTDMRKSFDGLMAIIRDTYELDPYANAVYLFCGRDSRKLKALHFDKDGFAAGRSGIFWFVMSARPAGIWRRILALWS